MKKFHLVFLIIIIIFILSDKNFEYFTDSSYYCPPYYTEETNKICSENYIPKENVSDPNECKAICNNNSMFYYTKETDKICGENYTKKYNVSDANGCKAECNKNKDCKGFSYHKDWKQCRFETKGKCKPHKYTCNNKYLYTKETNKICGNNYTAKEGINDVTGCEDICNKDKDCVGFSYHKGWKQCRFEDKWKSGIGTSCLPVEYNNSDYYKKGKEDPCIGISDYYIKGKLDNCIGFSYHKDWKQCRFEEKDTDCITDEYENSNYYNKRDFSCFTDCTDSLEYEKNDNMICKNDYTVKEGVTDASECQVVCDDDPNCKGYSYYKDGKQCRFENKKNNNGKIFCNPEYYENSDYYKKKCLNDTSQNKKCNHDDTICYEMTNDMICSNYYMTQDGVDEVECLNKCSKMKHCHGFSYHPVWKQCRYEFGNDCEPSDYKNSTYYKKKISDISGNTISNVRVKVTSPFKENGKFKTKELTIPCNNKVMSGPKSKEFTTELHDGNCLKQDRCAVSADESCSVQIKKEDRCWKNNVNNNFSDPGYNVSKNGCEADICRRVIDSSGNPTFDCSKKTTVKISGIFGDKIEEISCDDKAYDGTESQAFPTSSQCTAKDKCMIKADNKCNISIQKKDRCHDNNKFSFYGDRAEKDGCKASKCKKKNNTICSNIYTSKPLEAGESSEDTEDRCRLKCNEDPKCTGYSFTNSFEDGKCRLQNKGMTCDTQNYNDSIYYNCEDNNLTIAIMDKKQTPKIAEIPCTQCVKKSNLICSNNYTVRNHKFEDECKDDCDHDDHCTGYSFTNSFDDGKCRLENRMKSCEPSTYSNSNFYDCKDNIVSGIDDGPYNTELHKCGKYDKCLVKTDTKCKNIATKYLDRCPSNKYAFSKFGPTAGGDSCAAGVCKRQKGYMCSDNYKAYDSANHYNDCLELCKNNSTFYNKETDKICSENYKPKDVNDISECKDICNNNSTFYNKETNKICGENYTTKENVSDANGCKDICNKNKDCIGFSYHKDWKQCRFETKGNCKPGEYNNSDYYKKQTLDNCVGFSYHKDWKQCRFANKKDCKQVQDKNSDYYKKQTLDNCVGFSYAPNWNQCRFEEKDKSCNPQEYNDSPSVYLSCKSVKLDKLYKNINAHLISSANKIKKGEKVEIPWVDEKVDSKYRSAQCQTCVTIMHITAPTIYVLYKLIVQNEGITSTIKNLILTQATGVAGASLKILFLNVAQNIEDTLSTSIIPALEGFLFSGSELTKMIKMAVSNGIICALKNFGVAEGKFQHAGQKGSTIKRGGSKFFDDAIHAMIRCTIISVFQIAIMKSVNCPLDNYYQCQTSMDFASMLDFNKFWQDTLKLFKDVAEFPEKVFNDLKELKNTVDQFIYDIGQGIMKKVDESVEEITDKWNSNYNFLHDVAQHYYDEYVSDYVD